MKEEGKKETKEKDRIARKKETYFTIEIFCRSFKT
jgi:hypothetical protein